MPLMPLTDVSDGTEPDEVQHCLCPRYLASKRFCEAFRGHRGMRSMDRTLDVSFREDDGRTREITATEGHPTGPSGFA